MTTRIMRLSAIATFVVAAVLIRSVCPVIADESRRIVVFRDGTDLSMQRQVVRDSGSTVLRLLPLINGASITLPASNAAASLSFLSTHPSVVSVYSDPSIGAQGLDAVTAGAGADGAGGDGAGGDGAGGDHVTFVTPTAAPAVEEYPWGVERIGAPEVQQGRTRTAGGGVTVAVMDTGIDRNHPDLADSIAGGFNAIATAPDPTDYKDDNGHGTAMAGIIAARKNKRGVIGVAPKAKIFAVKVLDKNGRGHTSDTIYALGELMARPEIRVISMSYGTSLPGDLILLEPTLHKAVETVIKSGKIFVASRGNRSSVCTSTTAVANGAGGDGAGGDGAGGDGAGGDGSSLATLCDRDAVKYPAVYPEVITVGAAAVVTNSSGGSVLTVPDYSLRGVDVVAPGGNVLTTNVGGGYGYISGTSPAAAHVSGAVALALHRRRHLTAERVQDLLRGTAELLGGASEAEQGKGLIDVEAMVHELRSYRPDRDDRSDNASDD